MSAFNDTRSTSFLLVCHSYPPVLGGSEIEAQRVSAAMQRRGHSVLVITAGGDPMPEGSEFTDPYGVRVRMFGGGSTGRMRDIAYALGVAWTLIRRRREYQVVYFLMQGLHLALGLPVARLLGKPIVMKVSGSSIITLMRQSWLGRLELRWLQRWAYRVMVLNEGIVNEALAAGFERGQLMWMPNPVDMEEFAPCQPEDRAALRKTLGIGAEAPTVVYVGRLAPEKELPSLIGAFRQIRERLPLALLVLVGDGPMRPELEKLAQPLGEGVRLTGRVPVDQVHRWLQAADAFALVSSNEGLPCSLLEAMATGLPAVVSDIPANTQLITPGEEGFVAALGDESSIAEALLLLLEEDAVRRRERGSIARNRVAETFSTETVAASYEALFADALRKEP